MTMPSVTLKSEGYFFAHGLLAAGQYCRAFPSTAAVVGISRRARPIAGRMRLGRSILHAEEHAELLSGGRQEERVGLPFARLEGRSAVAQFPSHDETFKVDQRLVDDDRLQFGRLVHFFGVGLQITARRLFDILDAVERGGIFLFDAAEEFEDVVHIGALLVEVARIEPLLDAAGPIDFACHPVDREHPIDVPIEVVTGQLDLEVVRPSALIQAPSDSGKPSPTRVFTSASVRGSSAPTR